MNLSSLHGLLKCLFKMRIHSALYFDSLFLTTLHCSHKSVRLQSSLCLVRVGVQCMHCVVADTVVTPALTSGDWHWPLSLSLGWPLGRTALLASAARLASLRMRRPARARGWAWHSEAAACDSSLSLSHWLLTTAERRHERRSHNNPSIKRLKLNWRWLSVKWLISCL